MANETVSPGTELEIVAAHLAASTGQSADKCRQILHKASADPTFQCTDLFLTLNHKALAVLLITLRQESPDALNWLLAGCRAYDPAAIARRIT